MMKTEVHDLFITSHLRENIFSAVELILRFIPYVLSTDNRDVKLNASSLFSNIYTAAIKQNALFISITLYIETTET